MALEGPSHASNLETLPHLTGETTQPSDTVVAAWETLGAQLACAWLYGGDTGDRLTETLRQHMCVLLTR